MIESNPQEFGNLAIKSTANVNHGLPGIDNGIIYPCGGLKSLFTFCQRSQNLIIVDISIRMLGNAKVQEIKSKVLATAQCPNIGCA